MNPCFRLPLAVLAALLIASGWLHAVTYPPKPAERGFIVDVAELLSEADETALREQLDATLTATAIPIVVVTIPSLSAYEAAGMQIETYARMLYDEWGLGHLQIQVKGSGLGRSKVEEWNKGILLLVAVADRKARIELGAGFGHAKNDQCAEIMQTHIVPAFKAGDFPGGIKAGVKALSQLAAGEKIEAPPRPWWHYAAVIGVMVLAIFTFVSLFRRGASGWAWVFWAAVFGLLGVLLVTLLRSSGGRSGGFSGGSFGGGYSGGGGASGSW